MDEFEDIAANILSVKSAIRCAAARAEIQTESVELVAVSKRMPVEFLASAMKAGQLVFGENYVQEGLEKRVRLLESFELNTEAKENIRFHLIGHLQRNKVKLAVGAFDLIQTVDRKELAVAISNVATQKGVVQKVLIQVNISSEPSKSGVSKEICEELIQDIHQLPGIVVCGLMSIGTYYPPSEPEEVRRGEFKAMKTLANHLEHKLGISLPKLSMGMSHDFELAIEEGANIVRVGSAIFGSRPE